MNQVADVVRARGLGAMRQRTRSDRRFLAVSALLFIASATATIAWCISMSEMGQMPMTGGWAMSMMWMRMCGQTWLGAASSFLGMWIVMTVTMMLPSLVPMLRRYRQAAGGTGTMHLDWLTMVAGGAYFFVWTTLGIAIFPLGAALAAAGMQLPALARAVPIASTVVVLLAGMLQFTAWKARHLACCRQTPDASSTLPANTATAWRHGLHLGIHCGYSCAGLTAVLLVVGMMDLHAMAAATVAITAERLAPAGEYIARIVGAFVIVAGLLMVAGLAGLG